MLSEMPNEAGRMRNRDINSDRPGRAFSRMGGKRHALSTHESPHEREVADFAREVCARLKKAHAQQLRRKLTRMRES